MTDEWIWLWAKCLSLNKTYDKRKAIYADFGDLSKLPRFNSKRWHEWLEPRMHLFYPTTITIGKKSTTTQPKYKLSRKRAGDYQMRAVRRRLMAYIVLGPLTGEPARKLWQGKVQDITKTTFINLATKQKLWGSDWDEWGGRTEKEYKRMTIELVKDAETMIANALEGRFP